MSEHFLKFPHDALGEPQIFHPTADRVIEGRPEQRSWDLDKSPDGRMFAGVWETEAGAWRSIKGESWELCHILSGVSIIEEEGAEPVTVRSGDTFVMRPGFIGIWRAIEKTRKVYVLRTG